MAANDRKQEVLRLKHLLEECKDFIKNGQKEAQEDLIECQQDYQEACRELDQAKKDYQEALKQAEIEHYNDKQMQTMKKMMQEGITTAEKYKNQMYDFLEKAQKYMEELPKLLEQAKADQKRIEDQLAIYDITTPSPWKTIGGAVIWAIIIFILLKACGR